MRSYKSQCSIFKDLYKSFLQDEVEGETKEWMEQHKKECMYCKEWCNNFDVNAEDGEPPENMEEKGSDADKETVKRARVVLTIGLGLIVFAAIWMTIWLSI